MKQLLCDVERLKCLMANRDMNVEQLSAKTDISAPQLTNILTNKAKRVSLFNLTKIAIALVCSIDDLRVI